MLSLLIKTGNEVKKIMTTYPLKFITSLQIDLRKLLIWFHFFLKPLVNEILGKATRWSSEDRIEEESSKRGCYQRVRNFREA